MRTIFIVTVAFFTFHFSLFTFAAHAATVVQRGTGTPVVAERGRPVAAAVVASPRASMTVSALPPAVSAPAVTEPVTVAEPAPIVETLPTAPDIPNKSTRFADVFAAARPGGAFGAGASALRDSVRDSRAVADVVATSGAVSGGRSTCDADLRACMIGLCGDSTYSKCWTDNSIEWNLKMTSCRAKTKCTATEYDIIAPEFLLDRDQFSSDSAFTTRTTCNINYNNCILQNCGRELADCRNAAGQNRAIAACPITRACEMVDNGMVGRARGLFAALRIDYNETQFANRQRMRELVDIMRGECVAQKGSYDEQGMTCVYSVELSANVYQDMVDRGRVQMGESDMVTLATRKLYSAAVYQCTEDWFGVDISTYMENAQRRTTNDRVAYNSALASGLAGAVGTVTNLGAGGAFGAGSAWDSAASTIRQNVGSQPNENENIGQEPTDNNAPTAREQRRAERQAQRAENRAQNQSVRDAAANLARDNGRSPTTTPDADRIKQLEQEAEDAAAEYNTKFTELTAMDKEIKSLQDRVSALDKERQEKGQLATGYAAYWEDKELVPDAYNPENANFLDGYRQAETDDKTPNFDYSAKYRQLAADANTARDAYVDLNDNTYVPRAKEYNSLKNEVSTLGEMVNKKRCEYNQAIGAPCL